MPTLIKSITAVIAAPNQPREALLSSMLAPLEGKDLTDSEWILKGLGLSARPLPPALFKGTLCFERGWQSDNKRNSLEVWLVVEEVAEAEVPYVPDDKAEPKADPKSKDKVA